MLGKIIKYDMKAMNRFLIIIHAFLLIYAFFIRILITGRLTANNVHNLGNTYFLILGLTVSFGIILLTCVAFATSIIIAVHFYKSTYSDEGYLTFSLPVPRRTLYLAKTVNALIWNLATVGVVALIVTLAVLIIPTPCFTEWSTCSVGPVDLTLFRAFGRTTAELWNRCGAWLLLYGLEFLCGCVALILMDSGLVQLCITLGAVVAKKHKFLAAVGIYYAVQTGLGMLMQLLGTSMLLNMGQGVTFLVGQMNPAFRYPALAVLILLAIAVTATIGVILHFIALDKLERRLNLA